MITFELAILLGLIFGVVSILISIILKISPRKIVVTCILIAYLTVVASITLFPIYVEDKMEYGAGITWYNYVPCRTIIDTLQYGLSLTASTQLLGNILMTVPFGVMVLMLTENHKWWKILIIAIAFASSIEFTQMIIGFTINNMYRTVDIDDVILNTIGVYIGYGIFKLLPYKIKTYCTKAVKK